MTLSARVAYLKGLFDGMDYDKKDSRMISGILELLEDMAQSVEELEEDNAALNEVVDVLMQRVYGDESAQTAQVSADAAEEPEEAEESDGFDEFDEADEAGETEEDVDMDEQTMYQVVCPNCGEEIFVEESDLEAGSIQCPNCEEELEFDMGAMSAEDGEIVELPDGMIGEIPSVEENE